ncbi:MAG: molybdopterin molybdotransferase MoeA [Methanolinea sp.]|nr:molybdopterin molybdotransferase MoeA [Methanolinea sp.]
MSLFLRTISVDEARRIARGMAPPPDYEDIPLAESFRRVLAENALADADIPGFDRSVVDGFAVRASDTTGAGEAIPSLLELVGEVTMGRPPEFSLSPGQCAYIPTGGELPSGSDAVVMVEQSESLGDQILIKRPVAPGENLILRGEDFRQGSPALFRGRRISPQDCGVLAAVGCSQVRVFRKPHFGVISTGNELIPVDSHPQGSEIRDSNSVMIGSFLEESGCIPRLYGIVRDDPAILRSAIVSALNENDAVILSGGSSKDERDLAARLIGELGEVLAHGIAIAPGKPTILGKCEGKPIIGLPGHPASAFVVLTVIGSALFEGMTGERGRITRTRKAVLAENIPSSRGREDYVRVSLEGDIARPLFGKSGLLNTLVASTGMIRIPSGSEGLEAGEEVEVIWW